MEITELDLESKDMVLKELEDKTICFILCGAGLDGARRLGHRDFFVNMNDGKIFKVLFKLEGDYRTIKSAVPLISLLDFPELDSQSEARGVVLIGSIEIGSVGIREGYVWTDII